MDVFSQITTRESTEVPKRLFFACHCTVSHWAADGTRNSEFTNKLEQQIHGTELRIRRVSPCIVEAASAKADLFSQSDNENRPIKTKLKRLFFATGCVDATHMDFTGSANLN